MNEDGKRLSERGKAELDRIQRMVQAKQMSLDAALAHAFIAGTEHMAELRKLEEAEAEDSFAYAG